MNFLLTTDRLQLRPCQMTDLSVLHALWTSDRIRYFLFDDQSISLDEARALLADSLANFEQFHYGLWLVCWQNQTIGFAGFLQIEHFPYLVYGIHSDFWGQGYATEAARAVLNYGRAMLALPQIKADVDEPNLASVRVLQKLGMRQVGRRMVGDRPLLDFELT